jgi:hypothetical protein
MISPRTSNVSIRRGEVVWEYLFNHRGCGSDDGLPPTVARRAFVASHAGHTGLDMYPQSPQASGRRSVSTRDVVGGFVGIYPEKATSEPRKFVGPDACNGFYKIPHPRDALVY